MKITTGKIKISRKKCDDIEITMMQHSAEWLDWDDKDVWDEYHRKYLDIILVGHEHKAECVKKLIMMKPQICLSWATSCLK